MRRWLFIVGGCLAACGSLKTVEDAKSAKPSAMTFAGALVSDVSARVAHGKRLASVLGL